MKRITQLLSILLLFVTGPAFAQISLSIEKQPLNQALLELEKASGYSFFYSDMLEDIQEEVSLQVENKDIRYVMDCLLSGLDIEYEISGEKQVVLSRKKDISIGAGRRSAEQQLTVRGRVTDSAGEPVIGASVQIQGQPVGAITDVDGNYEIRIDSSRDILVFSYMGFREQSVAVGNRRLVDVRLKEDIQFLEEVVVVGYGVQKKVNLTGSVAMVGSEEMASRPISNVATGLQGMLPGVTVVSPSGQPGASNTSIRVRGVGTIGNANPLVLIDGVEGDIASLNPEDIESVSVLKDAASSAIYGARAANGVLLVTTRKTAGSKGSARITLGAYFGFQNPTRLPEMCDAIDFMTLDNEARLNVGTAVAWQESEFEKVKTLSDPNQFADTDWVGSVVNRAAPQQNYSVGLSGNAGNSGYMLSYRYFDQRGLTVGASTGEKRHNIRFKVNTRLIDRITLSSNLSYMTSHVIAPVNSLTSGGGALYTAMRIAPNAPVRYTDDSWAYGGGNTNPVALLHDGGRTVSDVDQFSIHETLKVDILKGWDATATYNLTSDNGLKEILKKTIRFENPDDHSVNYVNTPNSLSNRDIKSRQQTLILQTNFDFTFGRDHHLGGVLGMSQEWSDYRSFTGSRTNIVTEKDPTLNLGDPSTMSNDASQNSWAIRSGFGRLSYDFKERYLLECNLRYDLSSRFHPSNRGGFFPSVSGGWRISEEPFMDFARPVLNNLKLRASWGELGNQYVGSSNYPYLSVLESFSKGLSLIGSQATGGYAPSMLANPDLSWEKIKMLDIGFDLSLLDSRFNLTFDWYDKNTENILLSLNYPSQIGARPSEENAGKVNNRGWELDVNWRDQAGDFFYGIGFNLSDVKNKIVDLAGNAPDLSGNQIRMEGYPIDAFYGYVAEGLMVPEDFDINQPESHTWKLPNIPVLIGNSYQPGDIRYKDISGPDGVPDGRITPEYDKVVLGSNIPRYTYSARGNLGWKGIDFSFVLQGVGKCDGFLQGTARHAFQDMAAYPQKVHLDRYNVDTHPDPDASYPRLTYNTGFNQNTFSTFWLEDASYIRLKNVQLGYTFPEKWMKKARIQNLRIYFSGDNLLTASDFFYAYDPETPVSKGGYYPQIRTLVFGVNITFE